MTLRIEVDVMPGSDIDSAAEQLVALANRLGIVVSAMFNGVTLLVSPGGSSSALVDNWRTSLAGNHTYKMANARPSVGTPTHD